MRPSVDTPGADPIELISHEASEGVAANADVDGRLAGVGDLDSRPEAGAVRRLRRSLADGDLRAQGPRGHGSRRADPFEAARWASELGVPFHRARVETNAHDIELVFSDLRIDQIATGHTVLVIDETGPDGKIPL
ncbi:hypothetical protein GCM10028784_28180 [Myceligenerans cantabricum]